MSKSIRYTVIVLALAVILAALAWQALSPSTDREEQMPVAGGIDAREVVTLNPTQKDFALAQMRGLLVSLAELDAAEFAEDLEAAQAIAADQGPGQSAAHPDGFHEALPDTFRAMSRQMRQGFGKAAASAEQRNWQAYGQAKAEVQNTCITCHESYRIEGRD